MQNSCIQFVVLILVVQVLACGRQTQNDTTQDMPKDLVEDSPQDMPPTDLSMDIESDLEQAIDLGMDMSPDQSQIAQFSEGCGQPSPYPVGTTEPQTMMIDGQTRTWRVRLPEGYNASVPAPVLFILHGGFGSGEQIEQNQAQFNPIAKREGVILVYPDGVAKFPNATNPLIKARTWNAGACCGNAQQQNIDDVGFILQVLRTTEKMACVDRRRVYSTGMSNGAMMSYRLACDAAPYFAGIAPVGGSLIDTTCTPARPVPLLHIHGQQDKNVPINGGDGCGPGELSQSIAVSDVFSKWSMLHQCQTQTTTVLQREDVTCTTPTDCSDVVSLCLLPQGNHSWPGGVPKQNEPSGECQGGMQVSTFDASEYIWSFLREHTLQQVPPLID